jgi:hypothetical protein
MKSTTAQMAVSATSHSSAATETAAPAATIGSGARCAASAVTNGTRKTHSAGCTATSAPTGTLRAARRVSVLGERAAAQGKSVLAALRPRTLVLLTV